MISRRVLRYMIKTKNKLNTKKYKAFASHFRDLLDGFEALKHTQNRMQDNQKQSVGQVQKKTTEHCVTPRCKEGIRSGHSPNGTSMLAIRAIAPAAADQTIRS